MRGHPRETWLVARPRALRDSMVRKVNAAYADGLLSQRTLSHRLEVLLGSPMIYPGMIIGDLTSSRSPRKAWGALMEKVSARARAVDRATGSEPALLALDWCGTRGELTIGRHAGCDVVLNLPTVSRRHARLVFRDGAWILRDLESKNGTLVNDVRVGRCRLRPGDRLVIGGQPMIVD